MGNFGNKISLHFKRLFLAQSYFSVIAIHVQPCKHSCYFLIPSSNEINLIYLLSSEWGKIR